MRRRSVLGLAPSGFHRVSYTEWGDSDAPRVAVCVHGLTRNGRDFDRLAERLASSGWRVACPDMPGRGDSDWLPAAQLYDMPVYLGAMTALLARLDVEAVDWIGTSMGGIIGMVMASQPNSPIRRLVVNDIGGFVPQQALERLRGYVGLQMEFPSMTAAEAYLREILAGFGPLSDEQWRHVTAVSVAPAEGGKYRLRYDPCIGDAIRATPPQDVDLWPVWDAIRCPVLLMRGGRSDLLLAETAEAMRTRGPGCELVTFADSGHAPALMAPEQIDVVTDWLERTR